MNGLLTLRLHAHTSPRWAIRGDIMIKLFISSLVFLFNVGFVIASDTAQNPMSGDNANASDFTKWSALTGVQSPAINKMAAIRSALSLYHADHNGAFPSQLKDLLKYSDESGISDFLLPAIPNHHEQTDHVTVFVEPWYKKTKDSCDIATDTGGWGYIKESGRFFINCSHQGPENRPWCSW